MRNTIERARTEVSAEANWTVGHNFQTLIAGDANRSINQQDKREVAKIWRENYLYECDRLAQMLYIPNYRDPVVSRYRFERSGGEFIQIRSRSSILLGHKLVIVSGCRARGPKHRQKSCCSRFLDLDSSSFIKL